MEQKIGAESRTTVIAGIVSFASNKNNNLQIVLLKWLVNL